MLVVRTSIYVFEVTVDLDESQLVFRIMFSCQCA